MVKVNRVKVDSTNKSEKVSEHEVNKIRKRKPSAKGKTINYHIFYKIS